jgi:hypothetical protein
MPRSARAVALPMTFVLAIHFATPAVADMNDVVKMLLSVCLANGSSEQLEREARGEVALTLNALKSGKIGGDGGIVAKYTKSEWQGLQGGISSGLTALQGEQADKARECLKPYMPGIVQSILLAK